MPGGDGTGPMGLGPMTGRAAGYCAGYPVPGYMNPIPGRGYWGWGRGLGRGWGRGFGRGWGRGFGRGWHARAWAGYYPPAWGRPAPWFPPAYAYGWRPPAPYWRRKARRRVPFRAGPGPGPPGPAREPTTTPEVRSAK